MRSKKVLRYYCDYCSKGLWSMHDCEFHERICFYNPSTRSCPTCKQYEKPRGPHMAYCNEFEKNLTGKWAAGFELEPDDMTYPAKCERHTPLEELEYD